MRLPLLLLSLLLIGEAAWAVPFWGERTSQAVDVAPGQLAPGQFVWSPESAPEGPIVVVISLEDQLAYVYRNGVQIGYSTISSGRKGYNTPTGVFVTLQKDKDHRSSIYNNAAMPYTQRLTWGGVALHAGGLPGYPSSHGCVHLPSAFAELLFAASPLGMTVVVNNAKTATVTVNRPTVLTPVDAATGNVVETPRLSATENYRWQPELAPDGPVSIVISAADERVLVLRNGVEIGRARISLQDPEAPLGTHVFVMADPAQANARADAAAAVHWLAVGVPGHTGEDRKPLNPADEARVQLPPEFLAEVQPYLRAGTTLVVTDAAILPQTTGLPVTVLTNNAPET